MKELNNNLHYFRISSKILSPHVAPKIMQSLLSVKGVDIEAKNNFFSRPPKILVVDDSPIVQAAHMDILIQLGCNVDVTSSGVKAISIIRQKVYDLILLDIGLPKVNGIVVTQTVRHQESGRKRNIIVAVTRYGDSIAKQCWDAGVDDFYTKPLRKADLNNILTYWLPHLVCKAKIDENLMNDESI